MLEQVLAEFGLEWAPHKQRGPTQCIEFLGLLICNVEGARCIALTEGRQRKVRALIDECNPPCEARPGRFPSARTL